MSDTQSKRSFLERAERWIAIAAIISAVLASMMAIYQTKLMREQQRMSVWPYLTFGNSYPGGDAPSKVILTNNGIGPALIRSISITRNGKPIRTWGALLHDLTGEKVPYVMSTINHIVLPASQSVEALNVAPPYAEKVSQLIDNEKEVTVICYCSVYNQCWQTSNTTLEPEPVEQCVINPETDFQQ